MKSKLLISIALPILMVSIATSLYVGNAATTANPSYSPDSKTFTLDVSGQAYDRRHHEIVDVSISIQGTIDGIRRNIVKFHINGGDASVENFGTFEAIQGGYGLFIDPVKYMRMKLFVDQPYGRSQTVWYLYGKILRNVNDDTYSVAIYAHSVILPESYLKLTHMQLEGTITVN